MTDPIVSLAALAERLRNNCIMRTDGTCAYIAGSNVLAVADDLDALASRSTVSEDAPTTTSATTLVRYVLGFLFSDDRKSVALLRKNRGPAGMSGKLNGIGGHVEDGEDYYAAMNRETNEELDLFRIDWRLFCTMRGAAWECACYEASDDLTRLPPRTDVDEEIIVFPVAEALLRDDAMLNLRWLIPMALEGPIVSTVDYRRAARGDR